MSLAGTLRRVWSWLFGTPGALESRTESAWCLVGNVVESHRFGESAEIRAGSKHFVPGTKVYCLPPQWGDGYEAAVVVGVARGSRRLITVVMPTKLITNWRATVVYRPSVLARLRQGFEGFHGQWASRRAVEEAAKALRRRPSAG